MPNKQIKFKNLPKKKAGTKTTTTTTVRTKPNNQSEISMGRALLRALGGIGGGAAGLLAGSPSAGLNYGYSLGNSAATILGLGSYSVRSNSLYTNAIKTGQVPNMHTAGQSVIVRHKEYIGDVVSSATAGVFNATSFPINPGMAQTFPWLAGIANQYQEYTFRGLLFEYKSASADAIASSTNTALGTVILTTRYNPILPAPSGKVDALNEYYSSDAKPSEDFCHFIECDPKENPFNVLYVRDSTLPFGANNNSNNFSLQNYDLGDLFVCTQGLQGTSVVCGEIWASYEVELRKPIIADFDSVQSNGQFSLTNATGISTSNYFGTNPVVEQGFPGATITVTSNTINIIGPYEGSFMVFYYLSGSSGAWSTPNCNPTTNCVTANVFLADSASALVAPNGGSTTSQAMFVKCFTYSNTSALSNVITVTISGGTFVSPNQVECWVIPISNEAV